MEEECLHLRSSGTNPVSLTERTSGSIQRKNGSEERWWKCLPPWWACTSQRDEVCSPGQVTQTGVNISAEHDWWTADKYQKQNISPASTNELPLLPLSGTHLNTSTYEDTRSHKETSLVMNDDKRSLQTSGTWSVPQLTSLSTSAGVSSADTIGALRSKQ